MPTSRFQYKYNRLWIQCGYNGDKYNVDEINFPWEKTALHFSYNLQPCNCNN